MERKVQVFLELWKREWSQRKLAKVAGLPESTISQILNGRLNPNLLQKQAIAQALGKNMAELF